ncbi:hypothetical protein A3D66_02510 [Candidatus Kaiserbacteria bacterium RIFCSPHIGHO2_02_FULL_50_9]|nr:MAG: hypothetical protein A2761_03195 [Candidatus Kaiserbacteria bacterium RIFCSPHIGHO2_01_FULL_51_33]OGG63808.1 MAG: hypothetical protein A3D66_02510 [Candidatus Kaiserbacteria bacterium RIFCSPHIGHO2_02_FULL_50_9]
MRAFPNDRGGLSQREWSILGKLSTPEKIQDFLDTLPINFEEHGETYMSVARTLNTKEAHCFEGALLAACCLWMQGEKPLLLDFKTHRDEDHIVAPFKKGSYWGAISKTNHLVLRYRDPVFKTIRELAMSYFHEYFNAVGQKSLRSYALFSLLHYNPKKWISGERELFDVVEDIDSARHYPLLQKSAAGHLRKADPFVRRMSSITEWKKG